MPMDRFLLRNPFVKNWKPVSPDEAKAHRYYGFRGWLLALYLGCSYGFVVNLLGIFAPGFLADLGLASPQAERDMAAAYGESFGLSQTIPLMQDVLVLPFLVLAPLKHPLMPKAVIWSMWISAALFVATVDTPGTMDHALTMIVFIVGITALMTWYLLCSKRVNVTYLHRIPAEGHAAFHKTADDQKVRNRMRIFWVLAGIVIVIILIDHFVVRDVTGR